MAWSNTTTGLTRSYTNGSGLAVTYANRSGQVLTYTNGSATAATYTNGSASANSVQQIAKLGAVVLADGSTRFAYIADEEAPLVLSERFPLVLVDLPT